MAVVSGHPGLPRAALSPLRALFIVTFLFAISGGLAYLFVMPLRQVYWGVYSRMRPMISEQDVHASGRLTEPVEPELRGSTLGKRQPAIDAVHVATRPNTLTKELVRTVAINNTVMVTWANFHYLDFVMNWVQHVQATGCTAYLVGAMDDTLLELLLSKSVPTFGMSSGLTLGDFGWGTPTFHKMGREKIALIAHVTGLGFDVLISDVDTVWLRNPLPYLAMYPAADILTSSDHLRNTVADEGLERSGLLSYSRMTTCGTSKRLMIYTDVAQSHFPIVMTVCLSVTMPRSSVASCQFPSFAAATQASHRECQTNLAFCLTSCMPHFSSAAHLASDIVCASVCGGMTLLITFRPQTDSSHMMIPCRRRYFKPSQMCSATSL